MHTKILIDILSPNYEPNVNTMVIYKQLLLMRLEFIRNLVDKIPFRLEEFSQTIKLGVTKEKEQHNSIYLVTNTLPKIFIHKTLPLLNNILLEDQPVKITLCKHRLLELNEVGVNNKVIYASLHEDKLKLKIPKSKVNLAAINFLSVNVVLENPLDGYSLNIDILNDTTSKNKFDLWKSNFPVPSQFISFLQSRQTEVGEAPTGNNQP